MPWRLPSIPENVVHYGPQASAAEVGALRAARTEADSHAAQLAAQLAAATDRCIQLEAEAEGAAELASQLAEATEEAARQRELAQVGLALGTSKGGLGARCLVVHLVGPANKRLFY